MLVVIVACSWSPVRWTACLGDGAASRIRMIRGRLVQDIFSNRPINDGSGVLAIEMPYRAEDAAIVPVTLRSKLAVDGTKNPEDDYAGDRSEPGADGGEIRNRAGRQGLGDINARSRQQLHQCSCRGRTERRQALHGQDS